MNGNEMCQLSKAEFLDRTPGYAGDILYEHLTILQRDYSKSNSTTPPMSVSQPPTSNFHELSPPHPHQPFYPDHYQPPPHWYPGLPPPQLYAAEQYHHPYGLHTQAFMTIPQAHSTSYYRPNYQVCQISSTGCAKQSDTRNVKKHALKSLKQIQVKFIKLCISRTYLINFCHTLNCTFFIEIHFHIP